MLKPLKSAKIALKKSAKSIDQWGLTNGGLKLIMWSEGQWEASKKNCMERGQQTTNTRTDIATTRPNRPNGPIRWKYDYYFRLSEISMSHHHAAKVAFFNVLSIFWFQCDTFSIAICLHMTRYKTKTHKKIF